jgi:hypothetical protein
MARAAGGRRAREHRGGLKTAKAITERRPRGYRVRAALSRAR